MSRDDGSGREGGPPKTISALAETATAAAIGGRPTGRQAGRQGGLVDCCGELKA